MRDFALAPQLANATPNGLLRVFDFGAMKLHYAEHAWKVYGKGAEETKWYALVVMARGIDKHEQKVMTGDSAATAPE